MLKELLPHAGYVTSASPLITEHSKDLCSLQNGALFTVNNCFERAEFIAPAIVDSSKLRLVWFSQNITAGRGLELLMDCWDELKYYCTLTLIGLADASFVQSRIAIHKDVVVMAPLNQRDLHRLLSEYDVGLALELTTADLNKRLALSNKIFAYVQAGLYVVATDTPAQELFITENKFAGELAAQEPAQLRDVIKGVAARMQIIRNEKMSRFERAQAMSWEVESTRLQKKWLEVCA